MSEKCDECHGKKKVQQFESVPCPLDQCKDGVFTPTKLVCRTCKNCEGTGRKKNKRTGKTYTCTRCKHGKYFKTVRVGDPRPCLKCKGTGITAKAVAKIECPKCHGKGKVDLQTLGDMWPDKEA